VFLSHSAKDASPATTICRMLEAQGFTCWIAPRDVTPGRPYAEEILDGIESSDATVLILSENANGSVHVRNEIERAVHRGKAVFPFRLANVTPARSLELFVSSSQWIDAWQGSLEDAVDRLAGALHALAGRTVTQPDPTRPSGAPTVPRSAAASQTSAFATRTAPQPVPPAPPVPLSERIAPVRRALADTTARLAPLAARREVRLGLAGALGLLVGALFLSWILASPGPAAMLRLDGPAKANVFVDGQPAGSLAAGAPQRLKLAEGVHRVRVQAPGFVAFETTVTAVDGTAPEVAAQLVPAGFLTFALDAPNAQIVVDDAAVSPAPGAPLEVSPGTHRIEVRAEGFAPWHRTVTVAAGETQAVNAQLAKSSRGSGRSVPGQIWDGWRYAPHPPVPR